MKYYGLTILSLLLVLTANAQDIKQYTLHNNSGMKAVVTNYGARLVSLEAYNWNGRLEPIVKGYSNIDAYKSNLSLGATLVNVGGELRNSLADKTWEVVSANNQSVSFRYVTEKESKEFEGKMNFMVVYTLTDQNALDIDYRMSSTCPTTYKLTNGIVFNLSGDEYKSILKQHLWIDSYRVNTFDNKSEHSCKVQSAKNTPLCFLQPHEIGARIKQLPSGYNHFYQLRHPTIVQKPAAILFDAQSGRALTVYTYEPTLKVNTYGKESTGVSFQPIHSGLDDKNNMVKDILVPGQVFHAATVFLLTTDPPLIMKKQK